MRYLKHFILVSLRSFFKSSILAVGAFAATWKACGLFSCTICWCNTTLPVASTVTNALGAG